MKTEEKRTAAQLIKLQSLNLNQKIDHAAGTIEKFCREIPNPVISFSGGRDSTVLLHLIRNVIKKDIPAVFFNTGNEYPEIIKFVRTFDNVTVLYPKTHLKQIIDRYGFPLISKDYSMMIYKLRKGTKSGEIYLSKTFNSGVNNHWFLPEKYRYLINERFSCSDRCCSFLKKQPASKLNSITGEMASESSLRQDIWIMYGCNSFNKKKSKSKPLSIWTGKDIREYIRLFDVRICPIYEDYRIERTGCMFCGFGAHLEKLSRFEYLMENHPKAYKWFLSLENSGVTYEQAINRIGVVLPHQNGYQRKRQEETARRRRVSFNHQ
ncbi:MAG: phosphoadenosine phosphosulfate reductase family protein [Prevotellaceae bacterium]|nr:phosphoadenosine phosphosulfate reductase family protein [Prevotellaceae bacterium]